MKTVLLLALGCCLGLQAQNVALRDVKIYASPGGPPLDHGTVIIHNGVIASAGSNASVPTGTQVLPCPHCVVLAGFWNAHVHFMEPKWDGAQQLPAQQLTRQLQQMLTHSGFTTVVDTGSDPTNTPALRRRIESGEVLGPRIFTSGAPLFPPNGLPYYLSALPPKIRAMMQQPATPAQAMAAVEQNIAFGSDIVKLFTGSYVIPGHVKPMPVDIATAAVHTGHAHHQLVFAHASNLEGVRVAMQSGVDVLAHAPDTTAGVDDALIKELVSHRMAMIPTLKLFSQDSNITRIRSIVQTFHRDGGPLLFGTDTGFLTDYDMTEEYRQLYKAGLDWRDIIAMLTIAPVQRFNLSAHEGSVAKGMNGDLTVLSNDPANHDPAAFTSVRYTIRKGTVIYFADSKR